MSGDPDDAERDADEREDPFDELGDPGDRDGDPFERLDGPDGEPQSGADRDPRTADGDGADTDPPAMAPDERYEPDPFEYIDDEQRRGAGPEPEPDSDAGPGESVDVGAGAGVGAGPGAGVGADDSAGTDTAGESGPVDPLGDVAAPGGDPFETPGGVFEQVDVCEVDPDEVWGRLTGEPEPDPPADDGDDVVDVSKHSFCEGCEYFSAPPDVRCSHEGTQILEFTDVDTVRVANCPVVVERRELGGLEE